LRQRDRSGKTGWAWQNLNSLLLLTQTNAEWNGKHKDWLRNKCTCVLWSPQYPTAEAPAVTGAENDSLYRSSFKPIRMVLFRLRAYSEVPWIGKMPENVLEETESSMAGIIQAGWAGWT
jgi:hypothetical protein